MRHHPFLLFDDHWPMRDALRVERWMPRGKTEKEKRKPENGNRKTETIQYGERAAALSGPSGRDATHAW